MTTVSKRLSDSDFKHVVANAPLFAIDFVMFNEQQQILVGQRKNAPAKGFWFVPGGRVFKNESLEQAFSRLSQQELGVEISREQADLLGLYDHLYTDSVMSETISTHYINATHVVRCQCEQLALPTEQHSEYRWLSMEQLEQDASVHFYSKVFLPALKAWIENRKT